MQNQITIITGNPRCHTGGTSEEDMEEHQRRAAMSDFLAPYDDMMPNDMTPDGIMTGMSTDEQHAIEYQNAAMQVYLCVCM